MTAVAASVADQITAWATLAAVLVALGLSIVPMVWRRVTRPHLVWTVGKNEPYRLSTWEAGRIDGAELRIQVANKPRRCLPRRAAMNVRALLDAVWVMTPQETKPWGDLHFDVTPLRWASRRNDTSTGEVTVIPAGSLDYVEFARWERQRLRLSVRGARPHDMDSLHAFTSSVLRFEVVITADGVEPTVAVFDVVVTTTLDAVIPQRRPPASMVRSLGLFNVLGGLSTKPDQLAEDQDVENRGPK